MKAVSANVTKAIHQGTVLNCIDNTGAKKLRVLSVIGYKGRWRRQPKAGIGDVVVCSVIAGKEKMNKQTMFWL